ncbi:dehydrogenase E1 component subunit alpha/beta [bacterium]|nr:dehydrogenase E1 component subunit alpha/beta [bacterium]
MTTTEAPAVGKTPTRGQKHSTPQPKLPNLSREQMAALFKNMVMSRRIDDAEIAMRKRNQAYFQISGAGHEALCTAAGFVLKPSYDWFYPYYRDRALVLQLGVTPLEMLMQATGAKDDPSSHGRQMPSHFGHRGLNIVSQSSPTGSQCNQAVGCSESEETIRHFDLDLPANKDEIVYVSLGDGTSHQGEFHESLHTACIRNLRVLFVVENNGYAISVPSTENIPGGDIAKACASYPNLTTVSMDGTDLMGTISILQDLTDRMRSGEIGPVLINATVTRPYSHSLSDDHVYYRTKEELEDEKNRDPITQFERFLLENDHFTEKEIEDLREEVEKVLRAAVHGALDAEKPTPDMAVDHLYTVENSPLDRDLFSCPTPVRGPAKDAIPMGQAINRTLMDEMEADERILVFGQDVADCSNETALSECKGKGGVFKITHGLQRKFGKARCFNGPLAEANIVGRAIGMASRGLRPVCEVQFFDYIWTAMQQIRDELATMRYRSGGEWTCPVVVRVPTGGYLRGGGIYHSQTGECIFVQCPGLRVVYPSSAADAAGLLRTAIRCDDPVLFLEHKHLYYQGYNRDVYPGEDYTIPFGQAATKREGSDLTIITWGAAVQRSLDAASRLANEDGYEAEVIDIRTLNPLDEETIFASVRKTHRAVIVSEEATTGGFGGEIASLIGENCFEWLDAPVRRVGSLHTWVAYSPILEEAILPNSDDILKTIREISTY